MDDHKIKVLFVCLGNICRSPMAEGVFKKIVTEEGLDDKIYCDSAGTSDFHIGADPDERMCRTATSYSVNLLHKARQFAKSDFDRFDYIIAMDNSNLNNILSLAENKEKHADKVLLMREFDPQGRGEDVPDPYFGGQKGFDEVYHILERSTRNFLNHINS